MGTLPDDATWAVTACAEAELGDLRRTQRVVALATVLAQRPGASLPEACGDRATLKAAYRFFDNAAIAPHNLLDSHVDATLTRLWPPSRWCWPCKIRRCFKGVDLLPLSRR